MTKAFRIFLPTLAILLAGPALAAEGLATSGVNMRAGPGTAYRVIDTIPRRGQVEIHGCVAASNWCEVSWDGARGWVSASYLALAGRPRGSGGRGPAGRVPTVTFDARQAAPGGGAPLSRWQDRNERRHDRLSEGQFGQYRTPDLQPPRAANSQRWRRDIRKPIEPLPRPRGMPSRSRPWETAPGARRGLD